MTEPIDDARLEREIRDLLRYRDPGLAPYGLRERVLDVPARRTGIERRRTLVPLLGLAAALLLAAVGVTIFATRAPDGAVGASPAGPVVGSPVPGPSAALSFDPTLDGPGISPTADASPATLVVIAVGALGLLALALRGWRRLLPLVPAALLAAYALVASLLPVDVGSSGYGPRLNVVKAPTVPGSEETLLYEVAPPDGRFSVALYLYADAAVPVRLDGIVEPQYGQEPYYSATWQAVWLDDAPNGGASDSARPLTPLEIPHAGQTIWLVGEASPCAVGPSFDPAAATEFEAGFTGPGPVELRLSVLGWPRTVQLELPFRLVEPITVPCPGEGPVPGDSPSPPQAD